MTRTNLVQGSLWRTKLFVAITLSIFASSCGTNKNLSPASTNAFTEGIKKSVSSPTKAGAPIKFQYPKPWFWGNALELWHRDYFTPGGVTTGKAGPFHQLIKQNDGIKFVWEYGSRPCFRPEKDQIVWTVSYYEDNTIEPLHTRTFHMPIKDYCPNQKFDGGRFPKKMDPKIFDRIDYIRTSFKKINFYACRPPFKVTKTKKCGQ